MGGKPELQPGRANGGKVCPGKVLLSEMDEVASLVDRQLPVVVDDKLASVSQAHGPGAPDFPPQLGLRLVLDAQLHEFHAERHQALDPVGTVVDEVEGIEPH